MRPGRPPALWASPSGHHLLPLRQLGGYGLPKGYAPRSKEFGLNEVSKLLRVDAPIGSCLTKARPDIVNASAIVGGRSGYAVHVGTQLREILQTAPGSYQVVSAQDMSLDVAHEFGIPQQQVNAVVSHDAVPEFDHDSVRSVAVQLAEYAFSGGDQAFIGMSSRREAGIAEREGMLCPMLAHVKEVPLSRHPRQLGCGETVATGTEEADRLTGHRGLTGVHACARHQDDRRGTG